MGCVFVQTQSGNHAVGSSAHACGAGTPFYTTQIDSNRRTGVLMVVEPIQQIAGLRLLHPPPFSGAGGIVATGLAANPAGMIV